MSAKNTKTDDQKFSNRISNIEGEINAIRSINTGIHDEAIKSTKIFQIIAVLLTFSAGWFAIWSTDRVDNTLVRAEERIANLAGGFIPKSARVQPISTLNTLYTSLYIRKGELFGRKGFRLKGSTSAELWWRAINLEEFLVTRHQFKVNS